MESKENSFDYQEDFKLNNSHLSEDLPVTVKETQHKDNRIINSKSLNKDFPIRKSKLTDQSSSSTPKFSPNLKPSKAKDTEVEVFNKRQEERIIKKEETYVMDEKTDILIEKINEKRGSIEKLIASSKEPNFILKQVLKKLRYKLYENDEKFFSEEVKISDENFLKNFEPGKKTQIDFTIFLKAFKNWIRFTKFPNMFRSKIVSSLLEFIHLRPFGKTIDDLNFIEGIVNKYLSYLQEIEKEEFLSKSAVNQCKPNKTIAKIFDFYKKQKNSITDKSTFESIDLDYSTLSFSKFILFCKDFSILKSKKMTQPRLSVSIDKLKEIYQKNTNFSKKMSETQFNYIFSDLSQLALNKEFDKENNSDYSKLGPDEKLATYLDLLGINGKDYKNKMVGIRAQELKDSRIPENDLSKRYKLGISRSKKAKNSIQNWKESKNKSVSVYKEDKPVDIEPKVTYDYLKNAKKSEFDLADLIQENSSDEEFLSKLTKKKNLSQSISTKILNRAHELSLVQQKESKKVEQIIKGSYTKVFKYSKK